jgi:hypothetical protein
MAYWCFFLHFWDYRIIENIKEKRYITFPKKYNIQISDVILIYNTIGRFGGFVGYVRVNNILKSNLNENGTPKNGIFDDRTLNRYIVPIEFCKLLKKPIIKKNIFGEEQKFMTEFLKYLHANNHVVNMSDELGKHVRRYIKNYREITIPKTSISPAQKKVNVAEKVVKPMLIRKSKFIIPIMIVPCGEFKREIKTIDIDDRIQWIFDHIAFCRKCDITNNNERVSVDTIYDNVITPYKMTDDDEISTLLDVYHSADYYKILGMKKNNMTIVKIFNKESEYHRCYCIVGKLDCSM